MAQKKIPVMGHIGFTPQTMQKPAVKGKTTAEELELLLAAKKLEEAGCRWLVLELVKESVAKKITESIRIPTIGIGAGRYCSGQILVFHDVLGLNPSGFRPRFLKQYADLKTDAVNALKKYAEEVRGGKFPGEGNVYH